MEFAESSSYFCSTHWTLKQSSWNFITTPKTRLKNATKLWRKKVVVWDVLNDHWCNSSWERADILWSKWVRQHQQTVDRYCSHLLQMCPSSVNAPESNTRYETFNSSKLKKKRWYLLHLCISVFFCFASELAQCTG